MLLEKLNLPEELKNVKNSDLPQLCAELREVLLKQVAQNGGHLASNLGVVELTLMLHRVFDLPRDRIIWDVGHQAYVHKLLSGRMKQFSTLRQKGGISGFPKSEESDFDAFNTGHSSTSISAGLGMAVARDLNGEDYHIVSVIGDGSLTGGLAFEALNHAGHEKRNLLVVLNDNEMSIRKNVGALSLYLNRFRSKGFYYRLKQTTERFVSAIPWVGKPLYRGLDNLKGSLKRLFSIGTLFESLGFRYVGPIDGHNLAELETALNRCKTMKGPVLLHVKTVKGKGYSFAEETPNNFHGVGPFDPDSKTIPLKTVKGYALAVGETLCSLAKTNDDLVVVSAAMIDGTGLDCFAQEFPDRLFDVGIAEAHATTFSAGLAKNGKVPVFVVYSSFLQRGYDEIVHDVCMQNLHVVFAIDHAGLVGADGETHQGVFDVPFLKSIPNLKILAASNSNELEKLLRFAIEECDGPVAVRYEKDAFEGEASTTEVSTVCLRDGQTMIITYGRLTQEALKAADLLEQAGVSCGVVKLLSLKPLEIDEIRLFTECKDVFVFEECQAIGGVGETISAMLNGNTKVTVCGIADSFIAQGTVKEQLDEVGLSAEKMAERILEAKKCND